MTRVVMAAITTAEFLGVSEMHKIGQGEDKKGKGPTQTGRAEEKIATTPGRQLQAVCTRMFTDGAGPA